MPDILAFSADQVRALTGLSNTQLRYWDNTGFFSPDYGSENRREAFSRVYSYRNLVALRAIASLRKKYGIPLQELRKVGDWLSKQFETPWSSLTFYVSGKSVLFDDPITGARISGRPQGQTVFPIQMEKVERETRKAVDRFRRRREEDVGKVTRYRLVAHNAPILLGTRVPTKAVWAFHEAGYDTEAIIKQYPNLEPEDIHAAISYEKTRREKRAG